MYRDLRAVRRAFNWITDGSRQGLVHIRSTTISPTQSGLIITLDAGLVLSIERPRLVRVADVGRLPASARRLHSITYATECNGFDPSSTPGCRRTNSRLMTGVSFNISRVGLGRLGTLPRPKFLDLKGTKTIDDFSSKVNYVGQR